MYSSGKKKTAVRAFVLFFVVTFMFAVSAGIVAAKPTAAERLAKKNQQILDKRQKEEMKAAVKEGKLGDKKAKLIDKGRLGDAAKIQAKIEEINMKLEAKLMKVGSPSM